MLPLIRRSLLMPALLMPALLMLGAMQSACAHRGAPASDEGLAMAQANQAEAVAPAPPLDLNHPAYQEQAEHLRRDLPHGSTFTVDTPTTVMLATIKAHVSRGDALTSPTQQHYTLLLAAVCGDEAYLEQLLRTGANIEAPEPVDGNTPLIAAVLDGNVAAARLLIGHGADVNARSLLRGVAPISVAANLSDITMMRLLLDHGADANGSEPVFGHTPLHAAAHDNEIEIATMLLKHGAKIALNGQGVSPLHLAVSLNHLEMTKLLVEHGADVNQKTTAGTSLLTIARRRPESPLTEFLLQHGARE